ncbi:hypothetical protein EVAR_101161_1 [Eumeta japonica]|uniref:Uncharacterized protein n=1 Tax=Eumeta variegata TaxID=151549 RepID=A0A4C1SBX6_EUMVA|nr:hypothetical protein EVAR_101161_1 [Eumeta japonica]
MDTRDLIGVTSALPALNRNKRSDGRENEMIKESPASYLLDKTNNGSYYNRPYSVRVWLYLNAEAGTFLQLQPVDHSVALLPLVKLLLL